MRKFILLLICISAAIAIAAAQTNMTEEVSPDGNEYLLYLPDGYDSSEDYPLILYLHGAQALGNGIERLSGKGLPRAVSLNNVLQGYPFIMVAPYAKGKYSNDFVWNIDSVAEVLTDVEQNYSVDQDRINGVGISLGAKGIWDFALSYPDKFAGIIPISGNSSLEDLCSISDVAVWAFHGDSDGLIPMSAASSDGDRFGSQIVVNALKSCAPAPSLPPLLTIFKAKGHNGWDQVFNLSSGYPIYDWMESLQKGSFNNFAPLVNLGPDKSFITSGQTLKLNSFAMDPDDDDLSLQYAWVKVSGPSLTLRNTSTPILSASMGTPGTFTFRLTVTDFAMNMTTDEISINILTSTTDPQVTGLQFYYDGNFIENINNDYLVDMSIYDDPRKVNIAATAQGLNSRASIRFGLDENRDFFTRNDNSVYNMGGNNGSAFLPSMDNSYNIIATPFADRNGIGPGVSLQSTITFSSAPLPIELISFSAKRDRNDIILKWSTAKEVDHSHFDIHQSIGNTLSMQKIETIKGTRLNSNTVKHYEYRISPAPSCQKLYYQLRNIDLDGKIGFSKIVSVSEDKRNCELDIKIYPTPNSSNQLILSGNLLDEDKANIKVFSVDGQFVKGYKIENLVNQSMTLDISELQAGMYYIKIKQHIKKLVVKK